MILKNNHYICGMKFTEFQSIIIINKHYLL